MNHNKYLNAYSLLYAYAMIYYCTSNFFCKHRLLLPNRSKNKVNMRWFWGTLAFVAITAVVGNNESKLIVDSKNKKLNVDCQSLYNKKGSCEKTMWKIGQWNGCDALARSFKKSCFWQKLANSVISTIPADPRMTFWKNASPFGAMAPLKGPDPQILASDCVWWWICGPEQMCSFWERIVANGNAPR